MGNPVPGWIFGGFLIAVGGGMLWAQQIAKDKIDDASHSEFDRDHLRNRHRRRTQVAGMILLIGVMIPVGDSLIPWQQTPATFAIYWIIVLGLAIWTMLLAFADIAATRLHSSVELGRLKRQQKELEQVADQLRQEQARQQGERE